MSADPYSPPQARLARAAIEPRMPQSIHLRLLVGVGAAAVEAAQALSYAKRDLNFASVNPQLTGVLQVSAAFSIAHACVLVGLGYGIYRGSRTCALLALGTVLLIHGLGLAVEFSVDFAHTQASALVAPLLLCACYGFAVATTFRWQSWRAAQRDATAA